MKKTCFALLLLAAACGDNDDNNNNPPDAGPDAPPTGCPVTPGAWSAPEFATNAADALALRAQLDMLVGADGMRGAEQGTVTIDEVADLEAIFDGGTPALSANVHAGYAPIVADAFADFVAIIQAGPQDLVDDTGWNPGPSGGIFGARQAGINTGAIEVRQIVDKGVFAGGGLYHYALGLTEGTIDEATIDQLAAAWGSNDTLSSEMVTDSANYSFRMGFHAQIAEALTDAKAYAASVECTTERDEAIVRFFRLWEQSMLARTVFYANEGATALAIATSDDERANGLHELGEGLGLAFGFRGLPDPASGPLAGAGRTITDEDVEAILGAVGVVPTDLGASTIGDFVTDSAAFQAGVTALETRVKAVYQLSDDDIASYRTPTEG